ncbi:MAG: GNAT family N-acetyltransferase [Actinomycetales bacterium]|nr:GNAT family N-acetyltransferase [Candidatus Phosphoribacter baldrii]
MPPAPLAGRHLAGPVGLRARRWPPGRPDLPEVNALGVATAYRRRGVARALMEAAAGTAVSMAGTRLGLAVGRRPRRRGPAPTRAPGAGVGVREGAP